VEKYHQSDEFSIDLSMPVDKLSNKTYPGSYFEKVGAVQVESRAVLTPKSVPVTAKPMGTNTTGRWIVDEPGTDDIF
jgi:hypothetical protein